MALILAEISSWIERHPLWVFFVGVGAVLLMVAVDSYRDSRDQAKHDAAQKRVNRTLGRHL